MLSWTKLTAASRPVALLAAAVMYSGVALGQARDGAQPYPTGPAADAPRLDRLASSLYDIDVSRIALPADTGARSSIAALGQGLLLLTSRGKLYLARPQEAAPAFRHLGRDLPFDRGAAAFDRFNPLSVTTLAVAVREDPSGGYEVFATHVAADDANRCVFVRLVANRIRLSAEGVPALSGEWRVVHDTRPCIPATDIDPEMLFLGGGRLAFAGDDLLMSVGTFGRDIGENGVPVAQDETGEYGKILAFSGGAGTPRIFSRGHRNPQGLFVGAGGTVYETEHGPQGGDELNVVEEGANHGWPFVTYGVQYGKHGWDWSTAQQRHEHYAKPLFAFVPSVAPSQVLQLRGDAFPGWAGDLMVGSLKAQALHHVRVEDGRVVFVEPVHVGQRIRDMVELADGRIALLTDTPELLILSPAGAAMPEASPQQEHQAQLAALAQAGLTVRGDADAGAALFADACAFCHTVAQDAARGPAPGLACVFGRRVAARPDFVYSAGLRARSAERWGHENLASYLADTAAFAPGTFMSTVAMRGEGDIDNLVAYLLRQTLQECSRSAGPAPLAATDETECGSPTPLVSHTACSRLIDAGGLDKTSLASAHRNRAAALERLGQRASALADLDAALRIDPAFIPARTARAELHFSEAEFDLAIADYTSVLDRDPDNVEALNARGVAFKDKGDYPRAIADFDRSIGLDPASGYTYNSRGDAWGRSGQYDRAIADFDRSIAINPDYAKVWYNRANALKDKGELARSLTDYDRAIALDAQDASAWMMRGAVRRDTGDMAGAMADFDRAVDLDPASASAFFHRALAWARQGDFGRAIEDYDRSLLLDPPRAHVLYNRGLAFRAVRELPRAIADFDAAIALDPRFAHAYFNRGLAHRAAGNQDAAIADFDAAIGLGESLAPARYNRGLARADKGELDAAIADFDSAIEADPAAANAFLNRSIVWSRKGDAARAATDCAHALRLEPALARQGPGGGPVCETQR